MKKTPSKNSKKLDYKKLFKVVDKCNVICNLCNKNVKTSGNTTNKKKHLDVNHAEEIKLLTVNPDDPDETTENTDSGPNNHPNILQV